MTVLQLSNRTVNSKKFLGRLQVTEMFLESIARSNEEHICHWKRAVLKMPKDI